MEQPGLHLTLLSRQDEYTILPHSFVIGIHGYVLVYSVTSLRRSVGAWGEGGVILLGLPLCLPLL